jgi:hypothetical protein
MVYKTAERAEKMMISARILVWNIVLFVCILFPSASIIWVRFYGSTAVQLSSQPGHSPSSPETLKLINIISLYMKLAGQISFFSARYQTDAAHVKLHKKKMTRKLSNARKNYGIISHSEQEWRHLPQTFFSIQVKRKGFETFGKLWRFLLVEGYSCL